MEEDRPGTEKKRALGRRGVIALAAGTVAVLVVVLLFVVGGSGTLEPGKPKELSPQELQDAASGGGGPVYWAGAMEGTKLEVTQTSQGHVFVRYLQKPAPVGDNKPQYTTVATYPQADALQAVQRAGRGRGMVSRDVSGGGLAIWSRARPTSVYVGLPNSDRLVEVFAPDAETARGLAVSGRIQPAS